MAGASLAEIHERLASGLREGRWDPTLLREMAAEFGTKATEAFIAASIRHAGTSS